MHELTTAYSSAAIGILGALIPLLIVLLLWSLILKGFALWHAARGNHLWWFIALLIINTLGILEIIYLIWFRPKTSQPAASAVSSETHG